MKKIWITAVQTDNNQVQKLASSLKPYGIEAHGHFWSNNLSKMEWIELSSRLLSKDISLWAILVDPKELMNSDVRFGLSVTALRILSQSRRTPVVVIHTSPDADLLKNLNSPLNQFETISASSPALGPKLIAAMHKKSSTKGSDYRFDLLGGPEIGQWFEIGPNSGIWKGSVFGVTDGEITFQAVGPRGALPEKSILEYPIRGMKLKLKNAEYSAWSVRNELTPETSHFIRVNGFPEAILFGPAPSDQEAEVYSLKLK